MLEAYYKLLSDSLRQSYAPPESLVEACMNGYDAQFMFLMRQEKSGNSSRDRVKGLLVFSQENNINRKPIIDQAALKV